MDEYMDSVARSASISVEADRTRRILRHDKREKEKDEAPRREAADTTWPEWEPTMGTIPIAIAEVAPWKTEVGAPRGGHHHLPTYLCTDRLLVDPPIAEMKKLLRAMEA